MLAGMTLLVAVAFLDFRERDASRMMMTFYTIADGKDLSEERTVKNTGNQDMDAKVTRFVDEILLGPISYKTAGFFPVATVQSCMVNGDTVYIDLPSPVVWAGIKDAEDRLTVDPTRSFDRLKKDIKRNFRSLKNVVFFIDGREIAG
jgi:hypothetical protein